MTNGDSHWSVSATSHAIAAPRPKAPATTSSVAGEVLPSIAKNGTAMLTLALRDI